MDERTERRARGQRMRDAAKAAGYTSSRLGERLNVEDGTVRGWWRGRSMPNLDRLRAYARAVNVPADYLLSGSREPSAGFDSVLSVVAAAPAGPDLASLSDDHLTRLMENTVHEVRRRLTDRR